MVSGGGGGMLNCPLEFLQGFLLLAKLRIDDPQSVAEHAARICLLVQNQHGHFLFQVARYIGMIVVGDLKILFLCDSAILEREGLSKILCGGFSATNAEIRMAEHGVGRTELRVEFDGPFKKWNGLTSLSSTALYAPLSVALQCVERPGGRKIQRSIELFKRAELFPQLRSQSRSCSAQRGDYLILRIRFL